MTPYDPAANKVTWVPSSLVRGGYDSDDGIYRIVPTLYGFVLWAWNRPEGNGFYERHFVTLAEAQAHAEGL